MFTGLSEGDSVLIVINILDYVFAAYILLRKYLLGYGSPYFSLLFILFQAILYIEIKTGYWLCKKKNCDL